MSNERLAEIKALITARNPAIDDMDTLRFIYDLRTASSDALAELDRLRAELRERCEYLRDNQWNDCGFCEDCDGFQRHNPDCCHARLMKLPEGV